MFRYNKNKLATTHIYIIRQIKIPKNWVGNSNNKLNKHKLPVFVHFEHIRAKYTLNNFQNKESIVLAGNIVLSIKVLYRSRGWK